MSFAVTLARLGSANGDFISTSSQVWGAGATANKLLALSRAHLVDFKIVVMIWVSRSGQGVFDHFQISGFQEDSEL